VVQGEEPIQDVELPAKVATPKSRPTDPEVIVLPRRPSVRP
jgi:hypothetical protein